MPRIRKRALALACSIIALFAAPAFAHGVVGARFFPATIATDDPFAADELAFPTVSARKRLDDGTPLKEIDTEFEYSKTIWRGFALGVSGAYVHSEPQGSPRTQGFDNFEFSATQELLRNPAHEFVSTLGLTWEAGGTGARRIGAEAHSAYGVHANFGKGFGDLPGALSALRPLALTAGIGYTFPGTHDAPHVLEWGGAVEYSLLYLQNNVANIGLGKFAERFTPLVEFAFSSPTDRDGGGTTGTINPGLLWSGQHYQLGLEAVLPANRASGRSAGIAAQLHFYIDDLFPHSFGRPIFS